MAKTPLEMPRRTPATGKENALAFAGTPASLAANALTFAGTPASLVANALAFAGTPASLVTNALAFAGTPASLVANALAFAVLPQIKKRMFWYLRDSRRHFQKHFGRYSALSKAFFRN